MEEKKYSLWTLINAVVISAALVFCTTAFYVRAKFVNSSFGGQDLAAAYAILQAKYYGEIDEEKAVDGAIAGLVDSVDDPYTTYFTPKAYEDFQTAATGEYSGVGIVIGANDDDDLITVIAPIKNSPAEKAGIAEGDKILKVDGESFLISQSDLAATKMKGKAGTDVVLTIIKKGETVQQDITLQRQTIVLPSLESELIEGNIGYVYLSAFENNSFEDMVAEIEDLQAKGAEKLILDLRDNGGGVLDVCENIADYFLDDGQDILQIKDNAGEVEIATATKGANNLPLVVICNGNSASASEVLIGALKDNGRAKIVGTKTYGKGVIQGVWNLPSGGGLKVTYAHYFTPNGSDIDKIGITPDYVIEDENEQLAKAIEILK